MKHQEPSCIQHLYCSLSLVSSPKPPFHLLLEFSGLVEASVKHISHFI